MTSAVSRIAAGDMICVCTIANAAAVESSEKHTFEVNIIVE